MTATHLVAISDPIAMAPQRWHNNRQRRRNHRKARTANVGGHNGQRGRQALINFDYEPKRSTLASPMPTIVINGITDAAMGKNGVTDAENTQQWLHWCRKWSRVASTIPKTTKTLTDAATMANNDESPRRYLQPHSDGPSEVTQQKETTKLRRRTRRTNIGGEIIEEEDMLKYQN